MSRIMKFESTNNQTNQSQPSFYKTVLVFVAVINLGFLGTSINIAKGSCSEDIKYQLSQNYITFR